MRKFKEASLGWFVVATRDYKPCYDWFWDKARGCSYGVPRELRTRNSKADLAKYYYRVSNKESYYQHCVIMPELQEKSIEEAAEYLRKWFVENEIPFKDNLDEYKEEEAGYYGFYK